MEEFFTFNKAHGYLLWMGMREPYNIIAEHFNEDPDETSIEGWVDWRMA